MRCNDGLTAIVMPPNKGIEPTASSVRSAPASGSS